MPLLCGLGRKAAKSKRIPMAITTTTIESSRLGPKDWPTEEQGGFEIFQDTERAYQGHGTYHYTYRA